MIRVSLTRAKATLWAWIRGVERGGEVVVLTRRGRDVAAIVPLATVPLADEVQHRVAALAEATAGLRDPSAVADALAPRPEEESPW